MRRPASATGPSALLVTPRDGSTTLPPFAPASPVTTPAEVWAAALAYADDVGEDVAVSRRRLALCAKRALYVALPPSIKKAEAIERLRGLDRTEDTFGTRATPTTVDVADDDLDEIPF